MEMVHPIETLTENMCTFLNFELINV
jgi:hypothetical protein